MKNSLTFSLGPGLAILALVALGLFVVRPVLAQVVASSTELILGTTTPTESVEVASALTTEAMVALTSTSTSEVAVPDAAVPTVLGVSTVATETVASPSSAPNTAPAESAAIGELVEVQLKCTMSYVGPLYDTPSGHLDEGYFLGEPAASTTGMIAAHGVGEQAWTKCYDATGKEYEYKIPMKEYNSYKLSGTPQKSIMLPPAEAALASFTSN